MFNFVISILITLGVVTDKPAYIIYNNSGEKVTYSKLFQSALDVDMIMFGELHNNTISHWLQLELTRDLHADTSKSLIIGFEMFEADQQILIDEYVNGLINTTTFEREARLWNNYKTDYKPVFEYGKQHGIQLVATNIPRRYASLVYSKGLEGLNSLSDVALNWIAPLPIEVDLSLPGYASIMEAAHGHGGENLPKSQAVKDATMAYFTLAYYVDGSRFLHLNGSYHSDNYEGIVWYLKQQNPALRILTITTVEAEDVSDPTTFTTSKADYTIVVPSRMTKTY
jgi:uncharacterized iron-regulated protein